MTQNLNQRYFLEIAFKGSEYHGWQIQKNAISVQQLINEAIFKLLRHEIHSAGCGRTDTGVHANSFFLHFDTHSTPDSTFLRNLNFILPKDIIVKGLYSCKNDAHARFSAIERSYSYLISLRKNPFLINLATFYNYPLDVEKMNEAASILPQIKDFSTFAKVSPDIRHYICHVKSARWITSNELLIFQITANRFLRSMVRLLVANFLKVGNNKMSVDEFIEITELRNPKLSAVLAPPDGLYLTNIKYADELLKKIQ